MRARRKIFVIEAKSFEISEEGGRGIFYKIIEHGRHLSIELALEEVQMGAVICHPSSLILERTSNSFGAFITLTSIPTSGGRRRWVSFPDLEAQRECRQGNRPLAIDEDPSHEEKFKIDINTSQKGMACLCNGKLGIGQVTPHTKSVKGDRDKDVFRRQHLARNRAQQVGSVTQEDTTLHLSHDRRKSNNQPAVLLGRRREEETDEVESTEEIIRNRDQELMELGIEKEEREKYNRDEQCKASSLIEELGIEKEEREKHYRDEQCRASSLIEEKDGRIKQLEATVAADKLATERLLEYENQDIQEKLQGELQEKAEEIDSLQKEVGKHEQLIDSLEKQVRQLHDSLDEKEQLHLQLKDREKQLEDQKEEIQASLAASESKLAETKKQAI
ncbi:hypothetical protein HHK36_003696 [Tetracentron sinense]|uniref:Uncharacterized protein n=1 Tax=Tetracentron sinense TaxID=13715 RepID=A0A835DP87_TETSI|nr:hypothetical protein HHK36_003696 [Tetracentron sinense]